MTVLVIDTLGAGTWTVPAGVTSVIIECWSPGVGGTAFNSPIAGKSGAGGQYAKTTASVSAATVFNLFVGTGYVSPNGISQGASEPTWFGDSDIVNAACLALAAGPSGTNGSAGSSKGDVTYHGGNGFSIFATPRYGAGGAAGPDGAGQNGQAAASTGDGGVGDNGSGGAGGVHDGGAGVDNDNGGGGGASSGTIGINGGAGGHPGGGGGAGWDNSGATGGNPGNGRIRLTFTEAPPPVEAVQMHIFRAPIVRLVRAAAVTAPAAQHLPDGGAAYSVTDTADPLVLSAQPAGLARGLRLGATVLALAPTSQAAVFRLARRLGTMVATVTLTRSSAGLLYQSPVHLPAVAKTFSLGLQLA